MSLAEIRTPARFEIRRHLGTGGFGVVYEAYDRDREAVIALKRLTRNDPTALLHFKREFRALSDLAHPNLVTLYELIADEEQWLLTMELVHGVNFLDHVYEAPSSLGGGVHPSSTAEPSALTVSTLSERAEMPARRFQATPAIRFRAPALRHALAQLADGVRYLHQHKILHRDIKPSNVLVTTEGRVVLLDFGLATELASSEPADRTRIAGTPEYMSPEQAAAQTLSEASDWYSVGVMLYRALTGRAPFAGSSVDVLFDKQQDDVRPGLVVSDLPDDLKSLCCDLLRRDPAARPSGAEILQRLSDPSSAGSSTGNAEGRLRQSSVFVGRQQQLAALEAAFEGTRRGAAVTRYVRGTSGMGKTALVREFLGRIREADPSAVVLSGRCYEQEAVPYKALDSIVDALADYLRALPRREVESLLPRGMWALARVFPVLDRVEAVISAPRPSPEVKDAPELRRRASVALREMLGRIAERHPLILFIDDLQWGDIDSAALLSDLLRPPDQPSLLLIACYRREEAATSPVLQALLSAEEGPQAVDVPTLDVDELSAEEAGELASSLIGDEDAARERAAAIARESGGHPFFIDQLVRSAPASVAETNLDAVLLGRAAQLPPRSRAVVEVAAVAGRPVDVAVVSAAADLGPADYDVIARLRAAQFIRSRATNTREIEPYHDRVRETIVAALAPETLKRHHARLAAALEASTRADPEALAVHFRGAGDDAKAAHYALLAADQASTAVAFERAARLYRLALDLQPGTIAERRWLWVKLGDALASGGRVIEAARAYETASEGAEPRERRRLVQQVAEQFLMGGYLDDGLTRLRSVLADAGLPLPATSRRALLAIILRRPYMLLRGTRFRERSETEIASDDLWRVDLCQTAVRSLGFTETIPAIELQMRHLLLALKVGEPYRIAVAMGFEAIADARSRRGRARAERLEKEARALVERVPAHHRPATVANSHVTTGMLAFLAGRWKKASRELHLAEQLFREQSAVPYKLVVVQVYTLNALFHAGDLTTYFRRIPECLKESLDRGNAFAEANLRLQNAHRKCFGEDSPEGALEEVDDALARWSPRGFLQVHATELFHRGDFALYRGDAYAAWQVVQTGWPRLTRSLLLGLESIRLTGLYLRARAALAMAATEPSRESFLAAAERDAREIDRQKAHWGPPLVDLIHAAVAIDHGDVGRAVTTLQRAEDGFLNVDMALHAAIVKHRRGVVIGGDEGAALTTAADQWLVAQGIRNPARMCDLYAPGRWTRS